jgi:hypothetical protein
MDDAAGAQALVGDRPAIVAGRSRDDRDPKRKRMR